jgi:hypothetical protein
MYAAMCVLNCFACTNILVVLLQPTSVNVSLVLINMAALAVLSLHLFGVTALVPWLYS